MAAGEAQVQVAGKRVPAFLYGTAWKEERTEGLTLLALETGFRAIDTANQRKHYFEAGVGAALARALATGQISRNELFLQTKFTFARGQDHRLPYDPKADHATQVVQSLSSSLEHLATSYVDSYVLHGPWAAAGLSRADFEVWGAMEQLLREGKTRLLGVSNVNLDQLRALCDKASVRPAVVQNRCYARDGWDREIRGFCAANSITYQGFSLLTANQRELAAAPVRQIVERTGHSLPAVVFRFALARGIWPLTGTSDLQHMRADLACVDLELRDEELDALETLERSR